LDASNLVYGSGGIIANGDLGMIVPVGIISIIVVIIIDGC